MPLSCLETVWPQPCYMCLSVAEFELHFCFQNTCIGGFSRFCSWGPRPSINDVTKSFGFWTPFPYMHFKQPISTDCPRLFKLPPQSGHHKWMVPLKIIITSFWQDTNFAILKLSKINCINSDIFQAEKHPQPGQRRVRPPAGRQRLRRRRDQGVQPRQRTQEAKNPVHDQSLEVPCLGVSWG